MRTSRMGWLCALFVLELGGGCKSGGAPDPGTASAVATPAEPANSATNAVKLARVLELPHRSSEHRARDRYRHPAETLAFFGLRDDMTVVELWPDGGWFTEILAPFLKVRGKLVVAVPDANAPDPAVGRRTRQLGTLLERNADSFGKVIVVVVDPPEKIELGPPGSSDLVLTFGNLHDWIVAATTEKILGAAFAVLKRGGVLGVVDHRARPGQEIKTGYVEEDVAIRYAESAGFKLLGRAEINANPKDTKDHAEGVWSLPPTLRHKDKDRDRYLAIGESDRMTLKFVKP